MMNFVQGSWPEPIIRVQHLAESGITAIPERYVKAPVDRPRPSSSNCNNHIPVIDMKDMLIDDGSGTLKISPGDEGLAKMDEACRTWGFFQVVNHGVSHDLMARMRDAWHHFFHLLLEEKQKLANSPDTYEGYGSRLGVDKDVSLDWSDYFFLHYLPHHLRDRSKWPPLPASCRELVDEYCKQVVGLGGKLMKILSNNLGLGEEYLEDAFGGEVDEMGGCLRVNYYPKCPQPDLTLGISPHSDPGGITILFAHESAWPGLQVRRHDLEEGKWITVKPLPNALIINLGDQIQVLTNSAYKSVEHRVLVNSAEERLSLAFFYNPRGDLLIKPAHQLVSEDSPPLYPAMSFNEYRLYIRTKGPCGKLQVQSLTTTHSH